MWWQDQQHAMQVARWGHHVLRDNPRSALYASGQAVAWIIKAAQIEAYLSDQNITFGYAPSCGSLCGHTDIDKFKKRRGKPGEIFEASLASVPSDRLHNYKTQLKLIGLDPVSIISRYEKDGVSTTLADFVVSGASVATLLYLLIDWAGGNLKLNKALRVYAFPSIHYGPVSAFLFTQAEPFKIKCKNHRPIRGDFFSSLYDVDPPESRFVPPYYLSPPNPNSCDLGVQNKEDHSAIQVKAVSRFEISRCLKKAVIELAARNSIKTARGAFSPGTIQSPSAYAGIQM